MLCEIWEQDAYSRGISIDWGSIAATRDSVLFVAQLDVLILELYFWRYLMIYWRLITRWCKHLALLHKIWVAGKFWIGSTAPSLYHLKLPILLSFSDFFLRTFILTLIISCSMLHERLRRSLSTNRYWPSETIIICIHSLSQGGWSHCGSLETLEAFVSKWVIIGRETARSRPSWTELCIWCQLHFELWSRLVVKVIYLEVFFGFTNLRDHGERIVGVCGKWDPSVHHGSVWIQMMRLVALPDLLKVLIRVKARVDLVYWQRNQHVLILTS